MSRQNGGLVKAVDTSGRARCLNEQQRRPIGCHVDRIDTQTECGGGYELWWEQVPLGTSCTTMVMQVDVQCYGSLESHSIPLDVDRVNSVHHRGTVDDPQSRGIVVQSDSSREEILSFLSFRRNAHVSSDQ